MHNKIFETHAHYDDKQFTEDQDLLLKSLPENEIEYVINVGANLESTKSSIELADKYAFIYAAAGVHPSDVAELNADTFEWLKKQTENKKVVAIGEIGLDYYWDKDEQVQSLQRFWFSKQMELAKEKNLPVIIHSRDAAKDTQQMVKDYQKDNIHGVIHCYSYSLEMAYEFIKMGYYLGIGGVVTFKNAKKLKEIVAKIPLEHLLLETDCPYMAPEPNRGKRNSSLYLPYIIDTIATIKNISKDEVIDVTRENAKKLFLKF